MSSDVVSSSFFWGGLTRQAILFTYVSSLRQRKKHLKTEKNKKTGKGKKRRSQKSKQKQAL